MSRSVIEGLDAITDEMLLGDFDDFYVGNKDPEWHYTWLNKKPDNIERMKMQFGYEIVGAKHKETAAIAPNAVGERVNGDLVLARMPRARYERLIKLREERNKNQVTAANDAWKDAAAKAGLKVEDTTTHSVVNKEG